MARSSRNLADVAALRAHGLSDSDIVDVALAAAAHRTLLEPELRQALTVGRPVAPQSSHAAAGVGG